MVRRSPCLTETGKVKGGFSSRAKAEEWIERREGTGKVAEGFLRAYPCPEHGWHVGKHISTRRNESYKRRRAGTARTA